MGRTDSSEIMFSPVAPLCAIFRRFLKRQGLKFTHERAKILDAVLTRDSVFEAEQLLSDMRAQGARVSKATIYRTLKHLLESGIISEVLIDSKQARYQVSIGRQPKAHLVCVDTQEIIEFPLPDLTKLSERICRQHGLEPLGHRFVVYGVTPAASDADQAAESSAP
jgi:Fur family ferric uptake transcriptional regulator